MKNIKCNSSPRFIVHIYIYLKYTYVKEKVHNVKQLTDAIFIIKYVIKKPHGTEYKVFKRKCNVHK